MAILLQKQILTCKNSIYQNDTEKTWKTKKIKKYQKWILTMQLIMQILTEKIPSKLCDKNSRIEINATFTFIHSGRTAVSTLTMVGAAGTASFWITALCTPVAVHLTNMFCRELRLTYKLAVPWNISYNTHIFSFKAKQAKYS